MTPLGRRITRGSWPLWRRHGRRWREAIRNGGQQIQAATDPLAQRAWNAGRDLARKVIAIQRAAQLPEYLVERSAKSVLRQPEIKPSDAQWREGYKEVALERVPGLAWELDPDLEAGA